DLLVLVAFDVVEDEGGAVAGRQLPQGLVERHAVNEWHPLEAARRAAVREDLRRRILKGVLPARLAPAETHQDLVDREAVKPGGELRLAAETSDLAVQEDEDVLRDVFGLGDVLRHAQAEAVDEPVVEAVNLLEGARVPSGGPPRQGEVGRLRGFVLKYRRVPEHLGNR